MSRKAAAVPASKVVPGKIYAIKHGEELARFVVTAVVTRRVSNHGNPHDYDSTIEGQLYGPDRMLNDGAKMTLTPDRLLGLYEEHVELVQRVAKEKAEEKRIELEHAAQRREVLKWLYDQVGLPLPEKLDNYKSPFHYGYSGIDITREGIKLISSIRLKETAA